MKHVLLISSICILLWSCKKQEQYNPDAHIIYTHWYETRSDSLDTLFSVYIPNTFSPNGDGMNDYFQPVGYFNLNNLKVLNKYNNVVFETNKKNVGWDGTKAHSNVTQGNYIYKLIVSDSVNRQYEYTGSVTLFR